MGTRFRAMLAPVGVSTGDGRRFQVGALEAAPTPIPFEWAREKDMGHDGSVVIGRTDSIDIGESEIWAEGELFDDVDPNEMPRLAEDVAEAKLLIENGTVGPSVDLDEFEGVPVREGTDEEVDIEDIEADPDMEVELLVTRGRIRAATLVSIPAFVETSRPMKLTPEDDSGDDAARKDKDRDMAALVASVAAPELPGTELYDNPQLTEPTPLTVDFDSGRIYGHIATWGACHNGFPDMCITPPRDPRGDYSWFHRTPINTADGLVWVGRITAGGDHPNLSKSMTAAMSEYDRKVTAAYVRAGEDENGIWVAGTIEPDLDEHSKKILSRRKVSGDWRATPDGLSMVEVLALRPGPRKVSEPGFPVNTRMEGGIQTALTASFGPSPDGPASTGRPVIDTRALAREVVNVQKEDEAREAARTELESSLQTVEEEQRELARRGLMESLERD